ncbi:hypothetical protein OU792_13810 [Algoriphagus sp. NF]|uniref:hypothetical protein n=1 Tax=Algoriphagus sp. NF TaxID=2992756 RepID=UPI00237A50D7|nr:hypothetical protein [Algoriphagus sp. NF]MDE0561072.1 hypothetical protein [Algoriphagus sp. NF]
MRKLWVIVLIVVAGACKSGSNLTTSPSDFENYSEDLSATLPQYPDYKSEMAQLPALPAPESPQAIDEQLKELARQKYERNTSEPYFNGYRILIYSGLDRDLAFKTQEELTEAMPDINPEIQYEQPRYLVKVGRYGHKIEALKLLYDIKSVFPTARIVRDRIQRKDFTLPSQTNNAEGEN